MGRAPPTKAPKRLRELANEITAKAKKPRTSGRLKIDSQLFVFTGVNRSSSSTDSRTETAAEELSGKTLVRIDSTKRSVPKRS